MKKPALVCWFGFLVVLPLSLGAHQVPSSTRISSSTTGISGHKNPEKIPLHVAAFSWFEIAATNMIDGEHPYRFAQDISNTRLSDVDQGVLKVAVFDFYLSYAPLLAAYQAKASTGKATGNDTRAFNKAKCQLALDEYEKASQQMSAEDAKQFAGYIEGWKHRMSIDPGTGSELTH
jgi:hypothetical protein